MIFFFYFCLVACTFYPVVLGRSKPFALAKAWMVLFFLAAAFRVLIFAAPGHAPLLARFVLVLTASASIVFAIKKSVPLRALLPRGGILSIALWAGLPIFIFLRHLFPAFDVDTFSYHIPSMLWLKDKALLAGAPATAEGVYSFYRTAGLEEFLLIPFLDGDTALWAGLVSGLQKTLALFSLLAVTPASFKVLGALAAYTLLVDDHFFFSGHSRFVYLYPALVGSSSLAFFFVFRAIRGHLHSLVWALPLFAGIIAVKYHGLFFAVIALALVVGLQLVFAPKRFGARVCALLALFKSQHAALFVALSAFLMFSLYGLNWIEEGNPVYPFAGEIFQGKVSPAIKVMSQFFFNMPLGKLFSTMLDDNWRLFQYAGNRATKWSLFILPLLFGLAFTFRRSKNPVMARRFDMAALSFVAVLAWILCSYFISYDFSRYHGRYPRFLYPVAILVLLNTFDLLGRRFFRFTLRGHWRKLQTAAGLFLVAVIVGTIDSRQYNVGRVERPNWSQIFSYVKNPSGFVPAAMSTIIEPFVVSDGVPLRSCLEEFVTKEGLQETDLIVAGKHVAMLDTEFNWPGKLVGASALRSDLNLGLDPDLSHTWFILTRRNVRLRPPKYMAEDAGVQKLQALLSKGKLICSTEAMEVFDVRNL